MVEIAYIISGDRGVLEVAGEDRQTFLQGLVSNDVTKATATRAIHAALLTPQGKYLHDFHIVALGDALYLDGEAARLADLKKRLGMFRLRSKVTLTDVSDALAAVVAFGDGAAARFGLPEEPGAAAAFADGVAYVDPRLAALGVRLLLPRAALPAALDGLGLVPGDDAAYDRLRLGHGVPDGSRDLQTDKAILLEAGFDELHGIDWNKGCYMGQELTARTKYRALIKKRLLPVGVDGTLPAPGTLVMLRDAEAGEIRSGRDGMALALLRLDAVDEAARTGEPLTAAGARLSATRPDWMKG
jgi:folate-binding protein YgfZ